MRVEPNTSRTRRFQEQKIPNYLNLDFDFYYKADFLSTSEDFEFGLKSSDGQKRSKFNFKSGVVYDYSGRLISTYRGETSLEYGLQKIVGSYLAYEKINSRPISLGDEFSSYELNPFDRFYLENNGTSPVEFNLDLRGFAPPTLYSPLTLIGGTTYSGNLTQSGWAENPTQGVKYGMFGVSVPAANGSVLSFETSGSGILNYFISGNNLAAGSVFPIEFDTYFGKVSTSVTVVGAGGDVGGAETGISLSLYGASNLLPAGSSLDFSFDYFSNTENDIVVELTSENSLSSPILSGFGAGILNYSGFISKSGVISSAPFITGTADLEAVENTGFNTQYALFERYVDISKRSPSRDSGIFYEGENSFLFTGVPMWGVYNGPFPQLIGKYFSGLGDITVPYTFEQSDEGVHTFAEEYVGFLNSGYSGEFVIASSQSSLSNPAESIRYSSSNSTLFPTGEAFGFIGNTVTGRGVVVRSVEVPSFFGEGTGAVFTSRIQAEGTGIGDISFSGNAYNWEPWTPPDFSPPDSFGGAVVRMNPFFAEGILSNGVSNFKGTGMPSPFYQAEGFPTGPSTIVAQPQLLEVYSDLEIDFVEGFFLNSGNIIPTGFGFTGRAVGYVNFGGGNYVGPVFPEPNDTGLYPYNGDNNLLSVVGGAFYGRGFISSSGSVDNAGTHEGIFVKAGEEGEQFTVTYSIETGSYRATYESGISQAAFKASVIYPARFVDVSEGADFLAYDAFSLEFSSPDFTLVEEGPISGNGFIPVSDLNLKYDLFYSENPDSFGLGYKEQGWFTPSKFERPTPYQFPDGAKKGYVRVQSTSNDTDSFDELSLKVYAAGVTGEVVISTNKTI